MVSMTYGVPTERIERILQSADIAIRDLLAKNEDPLALSTYLWILQRNKLSLINGDGLIRWGVAWIHRVFIEGQIGRRKDEEIASACLAVISLASSRALLDLQEKIRNELALLLGTELDQRSIPFRRSNYAVLVLLAACLLDVKETRITNSAAAIANAYIDGIQGGRLYGLVFCVQLLQELHNEPLLGELEKSICDALLDLSIGHEDRVYLVNALYQLKNDEDLSEDVHHTIEQIVNQSPTWTYLMVGTENVAPEGDGDTVVSISHLHRATLLDVAAQYHTAAVKRHERQINAKYQQRRGVNLSAFGFYLLLQVAISSILLLILGHNAQDANRYLLLNEYDAMSRESAILYLICLLFTTYFVPISIILTWTLYRMLVKSNAYGDQHIQDILAPRIRRFTKLWLGFIVFTFIAGVVINLISPAIQQMLK